MTTESSESPTPTLLSEREWDRLTNMILEECVVPVVGPELLVVGTESGAPAYLYDIWGKMLAEQANLPVDPASAIPLLYQVSNQLSQTETGSELAYDIDDIIRRKSWPVPEALCQLAQVKEFRLYVTTTVDHLLRRAISECRPDPGGAVRQILFTPRGDKKCVDLPDNFSEASGATVFHLFGATGPVGGGFAKTEDDLIEFSNALLDHEYAPVNLYDFLRQKTILLLGCHFPDWLGRFFVYLINPGRSESTINSYYVSSYVEHGLEEFLKRKHAKIVQIQDPVAFVAELSRRLELRHPAPDRDTPSVATLRPTEIKSGAVFLSYVREDREAVAAIKRQLEEANIDTWMDESSLGPGEEFEHVIQDNIKNASFFVAIISRHMEAQEKPGRYIWKEWHWAENVNSERLKDDCFIQPLVIDDTPPGAQFVERPIRDMNWSKLQDGRLSQEFVDFLSKGIRRYRRSK